MKSHLLIFILTCSLIQANAQNQLRTFQQVGEAVSLNGILYFAANDGVHGTELWKTDGTKSNTQLVKDIRIGELGSNPIELIVFKEELFFLADDGQHGVEIWQSDGTSENTQLLLDSKYGSQGLSNRGWYIFKDRLLLRGYANYYYEVLPKKKQIVDFPGNSKHGTDADKLFTINGTLYCFSKGELEYFNEVQQEVLPVADPEVKNLTDAYSDGLGLFLLSNNKLSSLNLKNHQVEELKSWPAEPNKFLQISNFTPIANKLFFSVTTGDERYASIEENNYLWVSDGTVEGTQMLKGFVTDPTDYRTAISNFCAADQKLYFAGPTSLGNTLWSSDGTPLGTYEEFNMKVETNFLNNEYNSEITYWNKNLYFKSIYNRLVIYTPANQNPSVEYFLSGENLNFNGGNLNQFFFTTSLSSDQATLWIDLPSPNISISQLLVDFGEIPKDSCKSEIVRIDNFGRKNLYFSQLNVSGTPFYITGEPHLPYIKPGDHLDLQLFYFPDSLGKDYGQLNIFTNDPNQPIIAVPLQGLSKKTSSQDSSHCYDNTSPQKFYPFSSSHNQIICSKEEINENTVVGSSIGQLLVKNRFESFTFQLVSGEGDDNNNSFVINKDQLIINKTPEFELSTILSVRIRALSQADTFENFINFKVIDLPEISQLSPCKQFIQDLDQELSDVAFIDQNTAMAVGPSTIIRTDDGGSNWIEITPDLPENYNKILCPEPGVIYVTGNQHILKTKDNGNTWQALKITPNQQNVAGLSIPDKIHGFVSTLDGDIYQTKDQGNTWVYIGGIKLEKSYFTPNKQISCIHFYDSLYGFAGDTEGNIFKTINGGINWQKTPLNGISKVGSIRTVQMTDRDKIFITTSQGSAFQSDSGGKNWFPIFEDLSPVSHFKMLNNSEGFLYSENSGIYQTTNGGKTWNQEPVNFKKGEILGFAKSENGIEVAVGQSSDAANNDHKHKLILLKKEATWETISYLEINYRLDVNWVGINEGFTFQEKFFRTQDGGLTWQNFPVPANFRGKIYPYKNYYYLLSGNTVYKTDKSGQMLENQTYPVEFENLVILDDSIWLAQSGKSLSKSKDGGKTWNLLIEDQDGFTYNPKITFVNDHTGFLSFYRKVYITNNQGDTWENITPGQEMSIVEFHFLNDQGGFVWNYEGNFFKTVNGGKSWTRIIQENNQTVFKPVFISSTNFLSSQGASIFETTDGGKNWVEKYYMGTAVKPSINKDDIYFVSDSYGSEGFIKKLTSNKKSVLAGNIVGEQKVVGEATYQYITDELPNTQYQWSTIGGTVLRFNKNQVLVQWDTTSVNHVIKLTTSNSCGLNNSVSKEIELIPAKDFSENNENGPTEEEIVNGIKELDNDMQAIIYPNPTKDVVIIDRKRFKEQILSIETYNINGQVMKTDPIYGERFITLHLSYVPTGIYFIRIIGKITSDSMKVIKTN